MGAEILDMKGAYTSATTTLYEQCEGQNEDLQLAVNNLGFEH